MVLSFNKDNFGKFHQDLPLLQLFKDLKMGVFLHKNIKKTFDDGISCLKTKMTQSGCLLLYIFFVLNKNPKVYLGKKINCLFPPIAELLRGETGIVFQETAVLGGSCITICLKKGKWLN